MRTHLVPSFFFRLIFTALMCAAPVMAAPYGVSGKITEFNQPGVGKLALRVFGDEFYGRTETMDGYTVVYDEAARAYCYSTPSADGQNLLSSGTLVGKADPAALGLPKHLKLAPVAVAAQAKTRREAWDRQTGLSKRWEERKALRRVFEKAKAMAKAQDGPLPAPPGTTTLGNKQGLTLLIDFDDDPATIPQAEIVSYLNADDYTGYGNYSSVKKYFSDVSSGKLTYTNVATIYIRVPNSVHPKSYYNNPAKDSGESGNELVRDALNILKALPNYNTEILPTFANLTVDDQDQIVATNVLYAGGNGGVWSRGLWPHSWTLNIVGAQELSPGGKQVNKYQITDIGATLSIGTFCHENGHMLCDYPDIYDYDFDSTGGAGDFSLMSSGDSNDGGRNPGHVDAYLRRASGWTNTVEVTSATSLVAELAARTGDDGFNTVYRYAKPGSDTEYFMFENRHQSEREVDMPASGLAIWHVDELGDHNNQSMVANTAHQNYEVTLVQADGLWDFQANENRGDAQDLYYMGNRAAGYTNTFDDASNPNAHWWDGSPSGVRVSNISGAGVNMTIQFGDPVPEISVLASDGSGLIDGISLIDFGDPTTSGSPLKNFTIVNVGEAPLTNLAISKTGVNASDFTVTNLSVTTLAPGQSAKFSVTFAPSSVGSKSAAVQITSNDDDENPFDLALAGHISISLAQALDFSRYAWSTNGSANWLPQAEVSHDGVDAAQSGVITHGQSSSLQMTTTEAGTLGFWWKVSSEAGYDTLTFYVDGVEQTGQLAKISGEVGWVQKTAVIPAGSHVVRWTYSKDVSSNGGADMAWVDQVVFTSANQAEIAIEAPAGVDLTDGVSTTAFDTVSYGASVLKTFTIRNVGTSNLLGFSISKSGSGAADFTVTAPVVTSLAPGASTTFTVSFSPSLAGVRTAAIQVSSNDADEGPFDIGLSGTGAGLSLAEAVDATALTWVASGNTAWFPQAGTTHDGVDAAQSGFIGNNQSSSIEATTTGSGSLSFWWKVNTEINYDFLTFYIDDVEQTGAVAKISGNVDWTWKTIPVPAGSHIFKWTYKKDGSDPSSSFKGTAWLDQVVFTPTSVPDIAVEQPAGVGLVDQVGGIDFGGVLRGIPSVRTFTIRNNGNANLTGISISKSGANGADFIAGAPGVTTLVPGASTTFDVTFTPSALGSRSASIMVASNDADENPFEIVLSGTGLITLEEALDTTGWSWTATGNVGWTPMTVGARDGGDTAKSGEITHSQNSSLQVTTATAGVLSFWWKVSSEANADYLTFYIDNVEQTGSFAKISGEIDWVRKTVVIPGGSHTLRWTYSKDGSVKSGADAGWVDQVEFILNPEIVVEQPAGIDLIDGVTSVDFGSVAVGTPVVKTFKVRNTGDGNLMNLLVTKSGVDSGDFTLSSLSASILAPGASTTFTVTFTPAVMGARTAAIHLESNDADENPFDIVLSGGVISPQEAWRLQYFGATSNTSQAADDQDPDGDGQNNSQEYAAGTSPTNGADYFKVDTHSRTGSTFSLTIAGRKDRTYNLERSLDLSPDSWTFVTTSGPLAAAGILTLNDTAASSRKGFYRVFVSAP
jgi:M6 family metalloprotease-like protein